MAERPETCGEYQIQISAPEGVRVNITVRGMAARLMVTGSGPNGDPTLGELTVGLELGQRVLCGVLAVTSADLQVVAASLCDPPTDITPACEHSEEKAPGGKTCGDCAHFDHCHACGHPNCGHQDHGGDFVEEERPACLDALLDMAEGKI